MKKKGKKMYSFKLVKLIKKRKKYTSQTTEERKGILIHIWYYFTYLRPDLALF